MTHSRTWLPLLRFCSGLSFQIPSLPATIFHYQTTKRGSLALIRDWMGMGPPSMGARRTARAAPLLISRPLD